MLFIASLGVASAWASLPPIPRTNEVVRYEREQPLFQSSQIAKEVGDALLFALDGGRQIQERRFPPGFVCILPPPTHIWMKAIRTNGVAYRIGVSFGSGSVWIPEGLYEVTDAARVRIARAIARLDEDLRREVTSATKPCVYRLGTVDDGGTLSGVARLFYGDATKWRRIYEANRSTIKNPNVVDGGVRLTIPKLR